MMYGNHYGYQPNYFNPTGAMPDTLSQFKTPYQPPQQNNNGLLWVQGEAGAKSFLVGPGQSVLLMDSESPRFYLKSADTSGMPLPLRSFEYTEVSAGQPAPKEDGPDTPEFITRAEFEERLAQLSKSPKKVKEDTDNG